MTEAHIGRLLAACLHEAIGALLPMRLEFYEVWLSSEGMRDGSIGVAPMSAVLGFLRTEPEYQTVVARAGQLAAQWTLESMSRFERAWIARLPQWIRLRVAARIAAGIVRSISSATRTSTRVKRSQLHLQIKGSLFCVVREPQRTPMCGFYRAVVAQVFESFRLPAPVTIERCLAVDGSMCVIHVAEPSESREP